MVIGDNEKELLLHQITFNNKTIPYHPDPSDLENEIEFYEQNNFDMKGYAIDIKYYDVEEYWAGHEECALETHTILKTPFDWTGYDKKFWWGEEEIQISTNNEKESISAIIQKGEGEQVEFKPALVYHLGKGEGAIGVKHKIAAAICAFLNARGGILLIGVNDNKEIQGLEYDFSLAPEGKDPKDYFQQEFFSLLSRFFDNWVVAQIDTDFFKIDEKDVFVIIVRPSKKQPVFLRGQYNKEFYARTSSSSKPYTDIEEIVKYCMNFWNNSDD